MWDSGESTGGDRGARYVLGTTCRRVSDELRVEILKSRMLVARSHGDELLIGLTPLSFNRGPLSSPRSEIRKGLGVRFPQRDTTTV